MRHLAAGSNLRGAGFKHMLFGLDRDAVTDIMETAPPGSVIRALLHRRAAGPVPTNGSVSVSAATLGAHIDSRSPQGVKSLFVFKVEPRELIWSAIFRFSPRSFRFFF